MKCVLCDQKKGKRFCPAKNGLICPQCCGEKRVLELDCPENCEYLKAGRDHEVDDYGRRLRAMDPDIAGVLREALGAHQDVVARLEYVLARERLSDRNLTDNDVIAAVDVLLETYQTELNGVLYEKTADDLRVEGLRRALRESIEKLRNEEPENRGVIDVQSTRLSLSGAVTCLKFVKNMAASFLKDRESLSGYVDFLARLAPREERRNSILMP